MELLSMSGKGKNLDINLNMSYVPNFLFKFIMRFFKDKLIKAGVDFLFGYAKGDAKNDFNKIIQDNYPKEVTIINHDITISMLFTQPPQIFDNNILLSLDAMAYSKQKGRPPRPVPSPISISDPTSGNISGSVSDESFASLIYTFILFEHNNTFVINMGSGSMTITFNLTDSQMQINGDQAYFPNLLINVKADFGKKNLETEILANFGFKMNYLDFDEGVVNFGVSQMDVVEHTILSSYNFINENKLYFKNIIITTIKVFKNYTMRFGHVDLPLYMFFNRIFFIYSEKQMSGQSNFSFYG
jgi:hypothetical protein